MVVHQDTTAGSIPIEDRLLGFLNGPADVLLIQSPQQESGNTSTCRYLAGKAWQQKQWVPVFVDLSNIKVAIEGTFTTYAYQSTLTSEFH